MIPRALAYPRLSGRRRMVVLGLALAAAGFAAWLLSQSLGSNLASGGDVHSAHASFEQDCAKCHGDFGTGVDESRCMACHEPLGPGPGVHTFDRHVLYASGDLSRLDKVERRARCLDCHTEHKGRNASITRVPDRKCGTCHFDSFKDHPAFFTEAPEAVDDSALVFTHGRHVTFVLKAMATTQIEQACLACHNPRDDGKSFQPISFDTHCSRCHLVNTPGAPLPVAGSGEPGVESLSQIRARNAPGSAWAFSAAGADFQESPTRIKKKRLFHRDPWVLDNLRRLRRQLRGDLGLADLLPTTGTTFGMTGNDVAREILTVLTQQADALRGRAEPEVVQELAGLDSLIVRIQTRLRAPGGIPLAAVSAPPLSGDLDTNKGAILGTVQRLTRECRVCHRMQGASFLRVQTDQRVLRRAIFNHADHVIVTGCTDCHAPDNATSAPFNLPSLESCRDCHGSHETRADCVTCHLYHPDTRPQLARTTP